MTSSTGTSWLRPSNSSARVRVPSSVSKRYVFSTRTHGSSRRCRASASPSLVCSFSRVSNASRAARHSSRVPTLWLIVASVLLLAVIVLLLFYDHGRDKHTSYVVLDRWGKPRNRRGREDDQDSKPNDRQRYRRIDGSLRRQELLGEDKDRDHGHPGDAHDAQRHQRQHQPDARADAVDSKLEPRADTDAAAMTAVLLERHELVKARCDHDCASGVRPVRSIQRIHSTRRAGRRRSAQPEPPRRHRVPDLVNGARA